MKGKTIDAFTSATIPQSTSKGVKELLGDTVKNFALSPLGVKLKRFDADCYLVLSGNDLHFFVTDEENELDEHLVIDNFRLEKATLKYGGILKYKMAVHAKTCRRIPTKNSYYTLGIMNSH